MDRDSVPNMSMMRTLGGGLMVLESAERIAGRISRMVTQRRVKMVGSACMRAELCDVGIWRMSQRLGVRDEFRIWDSASEVWEVTARMVTLKLWWRTKRFPSSIMGIRWPRPKQSKMWLLRLHEVELWMNEK